jgi:hypothetical protein
LTRAGLDDLARRRAVRDVPAMSKPPPERPAPAPVAKPASKLSQLMTAAGAENVTAQVSGSRLSKILLDGGLTDKTAERAGGGIAIIGVKKPRE